jgi:hypothetical protein
MEIVVQARRSRHDSGHGKNNRGGDTDYCILVIDNNAG